MKMLRPISSRLASLSHRTNKSNNGIIGGRTRFMATQSGDDAKPPTALATLYLEDGSKFVGRSFGSHEAAVDGEVGLIQFGCVYVLCSFLTELLILISISGCVHYRNGWISRSFDGSFLSGAG